MNINKLLDADSELSSFLDEFDYADDYLHSYAHPSKEQEELTDDDE